MSATPNDASPNTIQPLHNPSQAAQVVIPKAPLGNVVNQALGMGAKALFAKTLTKTHNPNFISPTDNLMTPVTQKLNEAKKKQFTKGPKPTQLFTYQDKQKSGADESDKEESSNPLVNSTSQHPKIETDEENPF